MPTKARAGDEAHESGMGRARAGSDAAGVDCALGQRAHLHFGRCAVDAVVKPMRAHSITEKHSVPARGWSGRGWSAVRARGALGGLKSRQVRTARRTRAQTVASIWPRARRRGARRCRSQLEIAAKLKRQRHTRIDLPHRGTRVGDGAATALRAERGGRFYLTLSSDKSLNGSNHTAHAITRIAMVLTQPRHSEEF